MVMKKGGDTGKGGDYKYRKGKGTLVGLYVCLILGEVAKHGSLTELTCPGYILNPCIPLGQGGREALS